VLAINAGLDAAIIDPNDRELQAAMYAPSYCSVGTGIA